MGPSTRPIEITGGVSVALNETLGPVSPEMRLQLRDVRGLTRLLRLPVPLDAGRDLSRFRSRSRSVIVW
jgi:hypothetical protein